MGMLKEYWKFLVFIPIIVLFGALFVIFNNIVTNGYIIQRDVELSGGKMITAELVGDISNDEVSSLSSDLPYARIHVTRGITNSLLVEIPFDIDENDVIEKVEEYNVGEVSIKTVGPALGEIFWQQAQLAIVLAFVFMSLLVLFLFRTLVPCGIVLFSVITDITITIAIMSMFGMQLSLAVLAALLMIIGYSVDTNILLTSEMIKRREKGVYERYKTAIKTGLMMSFTTMAALLALYFVSGSFVLEQIALVLLIGLIVDLPTTWLTNGGLLRWWLAKKGA